MYFRRPSLVAVLCLLAAYICSPALGDKTREPSCAEPWVLTLSPKPGAEDELSLLQASHAVAWGAERAALEARAGANASSESRLAIEELAQGRASLNSSAAPALTQPPGAVAASSAARPPGTASPAAAAPAAAAPAAAAPATATAAAAAAVAAAAPAAAAAAAAAPQQGRPGQSIKQGRLEGFAPKLSGAWMQEVSIVAQSMVTGMTAMEMTLLIVGILLSLIGFSYFLVMYLMSDAEEPHRMSNNPSSRSLPMPPKRGSPTPSRGSLTPVAVLQKYSLGIPSIKEAPYEHSKKSDFEIKDSSGKKLLNVEVMRPFLDSDAEIGTPHEYVSLHSKDGEEELAMCALAPSGDGHWECNVYQGETELYGHIMSENGGLFSGDMQFVLVSPKNERLLVLRGRPLERRMEVLDSNGVPSAVVDRGNFSFGKPGEYYQAECLLDADVGLIVLSLLAVDRLLAHTHHRKR